jgi:hypothetical protein
VTQDTKEKVLSTELVYFTLWFMVALATAWDIKRNQRFMQESLRRIEESAENIARFLGSNRQ